MMPNRYLIAVYSALLVIPVVWATPSFAQEPPIEPPSEEEGLLDTPLPGEDAGEAPGDGAASTENAKKTLLAAIDRVTPSEIATDSELSEQLRGAIQLFIDNRSEEAEARLEEIRRSHPLLPPKDLMVSAMLFTVGNTAQGVQRLEAAAQSDPDYPSIYSGFARIAISQQRFTDAFALANFAQQKLEGGNWAEEQVEFFRTEILDALVDIVFAREQWEQGLEYLRELRELLPENAKVSLKLAQAHFELEQYDDAYENLQLTKSLSEQLRAPEVIMADWYMIKDELGESKKWIERSIERYPDDGAVHLDYARWLLRNNQLPKAAEVAEKASQMGADRYRTTFVKGQIAFLRRSYDVAEMYFSRLNQIRPGDIEASNLLVLSLIESSEPAKREKAMQLATMNQRLYPRNHVILATLGWVHLKQGNRQQARQIFQNLVNVRPLPAATSYFMAHFLAENGETANAIQLLQSSLDSEGFFIYRSRAQQMLNELERKQQSESAENGGEASSQTDRTKSKDGGN